MEVWKRILSILIVTISCVGCDQSTKILASEYLPKGQMSSYFNDILRIGYTENIGAFLGLGSNLPEGVRFLIFVVLVGAFLFGLLAYLIFNSKQHLSSLIAFSLIFSGGLSNFYDRAFNNGAVIDFLNIGVGSLRTGVFNVADIAIMLGVFMLFFVSNQNSVKGS
jgi:signal peptidase II